MGVKRLNASELVLLCAIVLSGCALTDAHVNPGYVVEAGNKSPLSTIAPLTVVITVDDQRPEYEQDRVGNKKNNLGSITAKIISDTPPATILYNALKAEFEAGNHKVLKMEDGQADSVVKIGLKRYWSDFALHWIDVEVMGTLETDLAIFKGTGQEALVEKPFNGNFRESRQIALDSAFENVLRGALLEYVRSFARDPHVLDALKSAAAEKMKK
jgi:hypothetical protein